MADNWDRTEHFADGPPPPPIPPGTPKLPPLPKKRTKPFAWSVGVLTVMILFLSFWAGLISAAASELFNFGRGIID